MWAGYARGDEDVNPAPNEALFWPDERLLSRRNRDVFGMPPETFQLVISARLSRKYVDQAIAIIHQNPLGVVKPFHAHRIFAALFQLQRDLFSDGLDLFGIGARTDHKEIREGGYVTQVQQANVYCFLRFSGAYSSQPRWGFKRRGNWFDCSIQLFSNST